jgi:ankyrin
LLLKNGAAVDAQVKVWLATPARFSPSQSDENAAVLQKGNTPLHLAVWQGHHDVIAMLIQHKASVDRPGEVCCSCMTLSLLLISAQLACSQEGATPLHLAAYNGHCDVAALLIENGAAVDAQNKVQFETPGSLLPSILWLCRTPQFANTPLHLAAWHGRHDVAAMLIQHKASVDKPGEVCGSCASLAP